MTPSGASTGLKSRINGMAAHNTHDTNCLARTRKKRCVFSSRAKGSLGSQERMPGKMRTPNVCNYTQRPRQDR